MAATEPLPPMPQVSRLEQRQHLPTVLELEAAADKDPRRIYGGDPWTVGGFREYLKAGAGLVALNQHRTVIGFAMYAKKGPTLIVAKLVAPTRGAEAALAKALRQVRDDWGAKEIDFPLILDLAL